MKSNNEKNINGTSLEKATNLLLQFLTDCRELEIQFPSVLVGSLMKHIANEAYHRQCREHLQSLDPRSLFEKIISDNTPCSSAKCSCAQCYSEKNQKQEQQ